VTVSADDPTDPDVELVAADTSWYFGAVPGVELVKEVAEAEDGPFAGEVQVEPGATVWWRSVANTGNVDLTDVTIDDARLGNPVVIGDLAAGSSTSIVLARPGLAEGYANVATVTGEWSDCTVEDTDDAQVRVDEAADEPTGAPSRLERPAHVWLHPS
jgi:hypothetical protein